MKPILEALVGRRSFFKSAGMAAAGASALSFATERDAEAALQNVNTRSIPADLKITDLRVAVIGNAPMTCPIIRIDTPMNGASVRQPFVLSGWAIDASAATLGIATLHVWGFPIAGGDPRFLGVANHGAAK